MRSLLLLLALAGMALANIAPQSLEQRSRLGFLLSDETRSRSDRVAAELSLTDGPPLMEARLEEALGPAGEAEPARLYAAVTFLKRREQALDAYDQRQADIVLGQELLDNYIDDADKALTQPPGGPAGEALPAPEPPPWKLEETGAGLKVVRLLPYPTAQMTRGRLEQLKAAAQADYKTTYAEYARVEKAREAYKLQSLAWVDYVHALTVAVSGMRDGQILALPGANPHPPPTF